MFVVYGNFLNSMQINTDNLGFDSNAVNSSTRHKPFALDVVTKKIIKKFRCYKFNLTNC